MPSSSLIRLVYSSKNYAPSSPNSTTPAPESTPHYTMSGLVNQLIELKKQNPQRVAAIAASVSAELKRAGKG